MSQDKRFMRKEDLSELHYITPIENLLLILKDGILCNERSKKLHHKSVANPKVQERRAKMVIPGGLKLHCYANVYLNARNPMMRALVDNDRHKELTVISIDVPVLDMPNVVISDRNA